MKYRLRSEGVGSIFHVFRPLLEIPSNILSVGSCDVPTNMVAVTSRENTQTL